MCKMPACLGWSGPCLRRSVDQTRLKSRRPAIGKMRSRPENLSSLASHTEDVFRAAERKSYLGLVET